MVLRCVNIYCGIRYGSKWLTREGHEIIYDGFEVMIQILRQYDVNELLSVNRYKTSDFA